MATLLMSIELRDVLAKLEYISMVKRDSKINTHTMGFDPVDSWQASFMRNFQGQSRKQCREFIEKTVDMALFLIGRYHDTPFIKDLITKLDAARRGITEIEETYSDDPDMVSKIRVIKSTLIFHLSMYKQYIDKTSDFHRMLPTSPPPTSPPPTSPPPTSSPTSPSSSKPIAIQAASTVQLSQPVASVRGKRSASLIDRSDRDDRDDTRPFDVKTLSTTLPAPRIPWSEDYESEDEAPVAPVGVVVGTTTVSVNKPQIDQGYDKSLSQSRVLLSDPKTWHDEEAPSTREEDIQHQEFHQKDVRISEVPEGAPPRSENTRTVVDSEYTDTIENTNTPVTPDHPPQRKNRKKKGGAV